MQSDEIPWYADHDNIANLAEYMANVQHDSAANVAYMVGKPWKYSDAYAEMLAHEAAQPV